MSSLENPEMSDLPDSGRALQNYVGDVFSQQCARHISRYIFHELRWNLDNEFVRFILQAVFVADAIIHGCPDLGGRSFAGFYQRATLGTRITVCRYSW